MGGHAYLSKTTSIDELKEVLNQVCKKEQDDSGFVSILESNGNTGKKDASDNLTKREKEIIILIASGLTDKEIANKIFLSPYTVITHRRNLLSKLGLKNKIELTRYAIERGWA